MGQKKQTWKKIEKQSIYISSALNFLTSQIPNRQPCADEPCAIQKLRSTKDKYKHQI